MLAAVERSLPADVAVFAAAVADWRTASAPRDKIKKTGEKRALDLVENPDILATVGKSSDAAAGARHRLCGGDARRRRLRQQEAQGQGRRLDRRQRRLAGDGRARRRQQHRAPRDGRRRRGLADACAKEDVAERLMLRAAELLRRTHGGGRMTPPAAKEPRRRARRAAEARRRACRCPPTSRRAPPASTSSPRSTRSTR